MSRPTTSLIAAKNEVEFNSRRIEEYARKKGWHFQQAVEDLVAQYRSKKNINEVMDEVITNEELKYANAARYLCRA